MKHGNAKGFVCLVNSVARRISLAHTKQLRASRAGSMIAVLQFLVELWPAKLNLGHAACVRAACISSSHLIYAGEFHCELRVTGDPALGLPRQKIPFPFLFPATWVMARLCNFSFDWNNFKTEVPMLLGGRGSHLVDDSLDYQPKNICLCLGVLCGNGTCAQARLSKSEIYI